MGNRLEGRVALITGASRGIGKAVALALAKEGADIVCAAKTDAPNPKLPGTIHETAKEVEELGRRALPVKCDVRDAAQIEAMVTQASESFGQVDILVNNAGALWWFPVAQTPAKRFDLVMDVNVRASFLCAQAVLPKMIERKWGHIINMSPPIAMQHIPGRVAYMISKYGMTMLSLGLAEEVRESKVAVNSLWPVTLIESQATINFGLGDRGQWRKADIIADATVELCCTEPPSTSGQALLDEDVLKAAGITDLTRYACVEGVEPMRIEWEGVTGIGSADSLVSNKGGPAS